jgi:AhpD family alkylhydroperoxidase
MKRLLCFLFLTILVITAYAENSDHAKAMSEIKSTMGMVPTFMKEFPAAGLPGAWEEFKAVQLNPQSALTGKTKELIGLAVAAQIPCRYCVTFHKKGVAFNGGKKEEMNMALAVGAIIRKWGAYFNGNQIDMAAFKTDVDKMTTTLRKNADVKKEPVVVTDMKSAQQDMTNTFGFVPSFLSSYPEAAMAGAWNEVRGVILNSDVLPMKSKFLISLAVGSQAGCPHCVYLDTELAKTQGASPAEIQEAIAMAGIVRHWSTVLNGLQQDEKAFQREVDSIFKYLEKNKTQEKTKIGAN